MLLVIDKCKIIINSEDDNIIEFFISTANIVKSIGGIS